jgi:hypothetical protein
MVSKPLATTTTSWLAAYKMDNQDKMERIPEFAAWLENEYTPIAGRWMY